MTVFENVAFGLRMRPANKTCWPDVIYSVFKTLKMIHDSNKIS